MARRRTRRRLGENLVTPGSKGTGIISKQMEEQVMKHRKQSMMATTKKPMQMIAVELDMKKEMTVEEMK